MRVDFDWLHQVLSDPLWYREVAPLVKDLEKLSEENRDEYEGLKDTVYGFFEARLANGYLALGSEEGIWDDERVPIDKVVIHHTSNPAGLKPSRLSAMELIRLYAPIYANPPTPEDRAKAQGKPISSGHVREGKQVFWPYHWLIRRQGGFTQLLYDDEIGWHAGNWKINCRSIAICFDGDFENGRPSDTELNTAGWIIRKFYPSIKKENIFGHMEVRLRGPTSCPSTLFLGENGWKKDLLAHV